jgi:hypothetical protein
MEPLRNCRRTLFLPAADYEVSSVYTSRFQPPPHFRSGHQASLLENHLPVAQHHEIRYGLHAELCRHLWTSSVFTFSTRAFPAISRASSWTSGAAIRQGPHQAAQKSVRTGTVASATTCPNESSSTSSGSFRGGSGDLQEPQRPVSERCRAGMRFGVPQVGQLRTTE